MSKATPLNISIGTRKSIDIETLVSKEEAYTFDEVIAKFKTLVKVGKKHYLPQKFYIDKISFFGDLIIEGCKAFKTNSEDTHLYKRIYIYFEKNDNKYKINKIRTTE